MYVPPGITSKTSFVSKLDKFKSNDKPNIERPQRNYDRTNNFPTKTFREPIRETRDFPKDNLEPPKFVSKFDVRKKTENKDTKLANQYIQGGNVVNSNAKIIKNTPTYTVKSNIKPNLNRDHENDPTSRACWFVDYKPIKKLEKPKETIVKPYFKTIEPIVGIKTNDKKIAYKNSLYLRLAFNSTLNAKALGVLEKLIMDYNLSEMVIMSILTVDDTLTKQQENEINHIRNMFIEMEEVISNPKRFEKVGEMEMVKSLNDFKTESEIKQKLKYLLEDYSFSPKEIRRRLNVINERLKKIDKQLLIEKNKKIIEDLERSKLVEQLKYFNYEEQLGFLSKVHVYV
jgi:hypothetical protein